MHAGCRVPGAGLPETGWHLGIALRDIPRSPKRILPLGNHLVDLVCFFAMSLDPIVCWQAWYVKLTHDSKEGFPLPMEEHRICPITHERMTPKMLEACSEFLNGREEIKGLF